MREDEKCLGIPIEKPGDQHSALVWHQGQRLFCKNGGEYTSHKFVQCYHCNGILTLHSSFRLPQRDGISNRFKSLVEALQFTLFTSCMACLS
jgi:hypothetical protein